MVSLRRTRQLAGVLGASLAAAGCMTVGPSYRVPAQAVINAPAAQGDFTAADTPAVTLAEPPADWWRLYRDPALDALVAKALAANTDLRVAEANLERAQGLLNETRAAQQPDVNVNFNTAYTARSAEAYVHAGPIPTRELYDTGIGISYEVDLFGRIRRGVEAARAETEVAQAARDLARLNVVVETTRAYAEVCNAGAELDAARRTVDLQRQSLTLTRRLAAGGRSIDLDIARQQQLVEQVRANVPALAARQQNALYRLATLTGRPPAEFDPSLASCHTALRLDAPLPVGDGAALLKRRPDVRAAERQLAASTARIGVATAGLYPTVTLGGTLGTQGALSDFASALTDRYSIGPGVSWKLNQSVARARIAQSKAQTQADLARFDGAVLTALREVETALTQYAHDLDRLAGLQAARDHAQKVAGGCS